jgi:hypothetical protein
VKTFFGLKTFPVGELNSVPFSPTLLFGLAIPLRNPKLKLVGEETYVGLKTKFGLFSAF